MDRWRPMAPRNRRRIWLWAGSGGRIGGSARVAEPRTRCKILRCQDFRLCRTSSASSLAVKGSAGLLVELGQIVADGSPRRRAFQINLHHRLEDRRIVKAARFERDEIRHRGQKRKNRRAAIRAESAADLVATVA